MMTYFIESVSWLVAAEVVLKPKVQRMYHDLQREKDGRLQVRSLSQCISALQLAVNQPSAKTLCDIVEYLTVSASRSGAQHPASTEPEVYQ